MEFAIRLQLTKNALRTYQNVFKLRKKNTFLGTINETGITALAVS
jgi:hypothetical protein